MEGPHSQLISFSSPHPHPKPLIWANANLCTKPKINLSDLSVWSNTPWISHEGGENQSNYFWFFKILIKLTSQLCAKAQCQELLQIMCTSGRGFHLEGHRPNSAHTPLLFLISKFILEHCLIYSFLYWLWLLWNNSGRVEWLRQIWDCETEHQPAHKAKDVHF